ncbi:hypothetical protein D3C87_1407990 [compost metagenome]
MHGVRHGVAHDDRAFRKALGARRLHILGVQRIQQIAAHHPHIIGKSTENGDGNHRPDMADEIDELPP